MLAFAGNFRLGTETTGSVLDELGILDQPGVREALALRLGVVAADPPSPPDPPGRQRGVL